MVDKKVEALKMIEAIKVEKREEKVKELTNFVKTVTAHSISYKNLIKLVEKEVGGRLIKPVLSRYGLRWSGIIPFEEIVGDVEVI